MKGFVFQEFFDFVDARHGMAATEDVIAAADLETGGVYAATGTYPFAELQRLILAASEKLGADPALLLLDFGEAVGCSFAKGYATYFEAYDNLFAMLVDLEEIIHVEVKKLYPEAELPRFDLVEQTDAVLTMRYTSSRQLWDFAKGIIHAAAAYYREEIDVEITRDAQDENVALIKINRRP